MAHPRCLARAGSPVYKSVWGDGALDQEVGTQVAGYRIDSVIGRGGMGVVYLAEDLSLQRKVALKVLPPDLSGDPKFRERFVRESRLAASLDHPNIVPIFEAKESDGQLYIAMRYVQGMDLKSLILRNGALGLERAIWILTQAASALDAAHGAGLIHRDVKPANILVATGGDTGEAEHVYLSDFGLTKRTSSDSGVTATGQFIGTLDYAAPEQFEGGALDARTDVYSLGCVFYECLTGEVPYRRENQAGLVYAHLLAPPPKVSEKRPDLPPKLDPVVAKAMAKAPEDRYLTAGALSKAARQAVPGVAAPTEGFLPRGRQLVAMIVAFALIAAGSVAAVVLTRSGPPAPPKASVRLAPNNSVAIIDPKTNRMTGWVRLKGYPTHMVESGGSLWVGSSDRTLSRIDPKTRKVVGTVQLPSIPTGLAAGELGSVWVATGLSNTVLQINPQTNGIFKTVKLGDCCSGPSVIAVDGDSLWVANAGGTRRVQPGPHPDGVPIPTTGSAAVFVDQIRQVWVSNGWDSISVIEPYGNTLKYSINVPAGPAGLAQGLRDDIWVATRVGEVQRVSPVERAVRASFLVGEGPNAITIGGDAVWAASVIQGTVTRIDLLTETVGSPIRIGHRLGPVALAGGLLWAAVQAPEGTAGATGKLLFDEAGDIYVINADGTGRKQLTSGPEKDSDPDWSPDGKRFAFSRGGPNGTHILVANVDGSGLTQITQGPVDDFDPAWSRDGSMLAFRRVDRTNEFGYLWVVNADGSGGRNLTPTRHEYSGRPDWSPDNRTILFSKWKDGFAQLATILPDGTHETELTADAGDKDAPVWSPDGVRIAFAGNPQGAGVYLMSLDGSPVILTRARGANQNIFLAPSWSPDGTKIAFAGAFEIPTDLYLMNADGSGLVRLTTSGKAGSPDWQPVTDAA
jgi:serine/threonine protein kinase